MLVHFIPAFLNPGKIKKLLTSTVNIFARMNQGAWGKLYEV